MPRILTHIWGCFSNQRSLLESSSIVDAFVTKINGNQREEQEDFLPVESPLQISLNEVPFVVTMRTPGDDRYLARGLLFSERVVTNLDLNFKTVETKCRRDIDASVTRIIDVQLPKEEIHFQEKNVRTLLAMSSCGLCGKTHIADLQLESTPLKDVPPLSKKRLPFFFDSMENAQHQFQQTGGVHAASAFSDDGTCLAFFEDIGRHNAVDKVIGALLEKKTLDQAVCLTVSGRVSFEIFSKAYQAKIPFIAAVSSVSSLVVEMAEERNMTIIGFFRGNRFNVYSNPDQLIE